MTLLITDGSSDERSGTLTTQCTPSSKLTATLNVQEDHDVEPLVYLICDVSFKLPANLYSCHYMSCYSSLQVLEVGPNYILVPVEIKIIISWKCFH